ncbi:acyl-CoA thioesterase YciA [Methylohalomonas lacus]|uniref:Acyl-CoA thioesterase YciA n=1 Tax=Methylohalomonas lacus TaxID=398773 RepID=A0AAE3HIL1_9GAMM|nr:acyl-CoA thioesterase [Methylohalomonas lacus]MCS3903004.1 acyl-CoA thioesterase YciA [Methylohalomonas lacus]
MATYSNNMKQDLPSDREAVLRVAAMPKESNTGGSIFGGWLMGQVDIAAGIIAIQRAAGRVATVAVNNFHFREAVLAGDLVSCYAEVIEVGRTSMTIHVDVYSQRHLGAPGAAVLHVADAELTYVALDDERRPRTVPEESVDEP